MTASIIPDKERGTKPMVTSTDAPNGSQRSPEAGRGTMRTRYARTRIETLLLDIESGHLPLRGDFPTEADDEAFGKKRFYEQERFWFRKLRRLFPDRELPGAVFLNCDFRYARCTGFNLRNANFSGSDLRAAVFAEAILEHAILTWVDARWSCWRAASLAGSKLRESVFLGADLRDADLTDCDLSNSKLLAVDARRANLTRANLSGCDMRESDLREAKLTGAKATIHTLLPETKIPPIRFIPVGNPRNGGYYELITEGAGDATRWPPVDAVQISLLEQASDLAETVRRVHQVRRNSLRRMLAVFSQSASYQSLREPLPAR